MRLLRYLIVSGSAAAMAGERSSVPTTSVVIADQVSLAARRGAAQICL